MPRPGIFAAPSTAIAAANAFDQRDEALAKLRVAEDKIAELRKDLAETLTAFDNSWSRRIREK